MGAGRSYDVTLYFEVYNLNALYRSLNKLPRIKLRGGLRSVREIIPVSREDFMEGKKLERENSYLMRH